MVIRLGQTQKTGRSKLATAALIGGGLLGAGAVGFGLKKFLGKKKSIFSKGTTKRGSVTKLRNRVEKLMLKIKLKQLQRKFFKEQMRL